MKLLIRFYGLFVSLWFITNLFLQDVWWPFVVLDKFANYFLLASIPVLFLAFFTRNKLSIVLALLAVLVSAYFYVPLLIPASQTDVAENDVSLRVATYNIWNHNKDLAGVVELINATRADVIALQEITDVQQAELIDLLRETYPHFYVSQQVYGGTTALFSKIEISQVAELDSGIDRTAILAEVAVGDSTVGVVSAHLNPSFWAYHDQPLLEIPGNYHQYIKDQNTQARGIIDALKQRPHLSGAVLACDCNSQETASTNRLLRTYFEDTYRSIGMQLGEPTDKQLNYERKLSHIDYIWFAGKLEPVAVYRAKKAAGSDHAPVIADFR